MTHSFGDNDEISNVTVARDCPAGDANCSFEHVEAMVGIRMEVERSESSDFEIIHARFGCAQERPKMDVTAAVAQHFIAMQDHEVAFAFAINLCRCILGGNDARGYKKCAKHNDGDRSHGQLEKM
jgi:hypothetical protein